MYGYKEPAVRAGQEGEGVSDLFRIFRVCAKIKSNLHLSADGASARLMPEGG